MKDITRQKLKALIKDLRGEIKGNETDAKILLKNLSISTFTLGSVEDLAHTISVNECLEYVIDRLENEVLNT